LTRDAVHAGPDILHRALALRAEHRGERALAELVAKLRAEDRLQRFLDPVLGAGGDEHAQRIDHAVTGEGVDLQSALVDRQDLLAVHVEVANALVDPHDRFGKRDLGVKAGAHSAKALTRLVAIDDPHRLAEADHHALASFGNNGDAAENADQQQRGDCRRDDRMLAKSGDH
jgi:hypothetical protein